MEILLDDKGILKIVKGEEVPPPKEEDMEAYNKSEKKREEGICTHWTQQAEEIRHSKTAKGAWDTLKKLNESSTMANVRRLKREFLTTKMKPRDKVCQHAQKLGNIASQLQVIVHTLPKDTSMYLVHFVISWNQLPRKKLWSDMRIQAVDIEFRVKSKNKCSSLTMCCLMKIISLTKYKKKVTTLSLKVHTLLLIAFYRMMEAHPLAKNHVKKAI